MHKIGFSQMSTKGVKIGGSTAQRKDMGKWRCATCKMTNEGDAEVCSRCKDEKTVLVEKPKASSVGAMAKPEPMRFSTCKKPTGAAASNKL